MKKYLTLVIVSLIVLGCAPKKPVDSRYQEQNRANDKAMQELNRM